MEIPWGNLITEIATVVAVVIANRLAFTRSAKEKLLDLKRPAYGSILFELGEAEGICDDADEYIDHRGFHEYFADKAYQRHNAEIRSHMDSVRNRVSADYLILSNNFIETYRELMHDIQPNPNQDTPEEYETVAAAIRKHRPRLVALARSETSIRSGWQKVFWRARNLLSSIA